VEDESNASCFAERGKLGEDYRQTGRCSPTGRCRSDIVSGCATASKIHCSNIVERPPCAKSCTHTTFPKAQPLAMFCYPKIKFAGVQWSEGANCL